MGREHWLNVLIIEHSENDGAAYLRDKGEINVTITLRDAVHRHGRERVLEALEAAKQSIDFYVKSESK